jgi:hypothetical protein
MEIDVIRAYVDSCSSHRVDLYFALYYHQDTVQIIDQEIDVKENYTCYIDQTSALIIN